jgi:hypothetical protein
MVRPRSGFYPHESFRQRRRFRTLVLVVVSFAMLLVVAWLAVGYARLGR